MRALIIMAFFAATACGAPELSTEEALLRGGAVNLSRCDRSVAVQASLFPVSTSTRDVALAVCGPLRLDNTGSISGDVRVRDSVRVSAPLSVSGSLLAGVSLDGANTVEVGGDVLVGADWNVQAPAQIGGDATVGGTVRALNSVNVTGLLRAGNIEGDVTAGAREVGLHPMEPPLHCDEMPEVLSLARAVAVEQGRPAVRVDEPTVITLGCGRFALGDLELANQTTIRAIGPTQLLIDGSLHVLAPTRFETDPGASLELVIADGLGVDNTLVIDGATVAVSGPIRIAAPTTVRGALIAPTSSVALDNTLTVDGAMVVGSTRVAAPLVLRGAPVLGLDGLPLR